MLNITLFISLRRRIDIEKMRHEVALLICTRGIIAQRILTGFVRGPLSKRNGSKLRRWMDQNEEGFQRILESIRVSVSHVSAAADERIVVEQGVMDQLYGVDILTYSGDRDSRLAESLPEAIARGMNALTKDRFEFRSPERRPVLESTPPPAHPRTENHMPAHNQHFAAIPRAAV